MNTFFSSSLLCPKMANLSSAASFVRPSLVHLRFSNTSSMGMFSCKTQHTHTKALANTFIAKIKAPHNQEKGLKLSLSDPLPSPLSPLRQHQELQASLLPPSLETKKTLPSRKNKYFLNQEQSSRNTMGKNCSRNFCSVD